MKYLSHCSHLKSADENGEISGYASVFNVVDGYGDVVIAGAFRKAVADFAAGKKPKLLWQHDINCPVGVVEEIREDRRGLFVRAKLLLEISKAKEVYFLLKNKAIDGFSIGYRIRNNYFRDNKQYLTDIELLEVSIVTFPACGSATVEDVKHDDDLLQKIRAISKQIKEKINE
ncbi:MAG: HK97 family phage prohead protease [Holosporaceae bacterium]|jgi:HK97 family phage prohead protease|nr:HK97 family phage prohead protease [Holosporaceae bacterium]